MMKTMLCVVKQETSCLCLHCYFNGKLLRHDLIKFNATNQLNVDILLILSCATWTYCVFCFFLNIISNFRCNDLNVDRA